MRVRSFEPPQSMTPSRFVNKWLWPVLRWWVWPFALSMIIAKLVLTTWAPLPVNFYVWWLTGLIFLACRESMRLSEDRTILWSGIIMPAGISAALIILITYALHKLARAPTQGLLLFCAIGACGFLLFTILWVILFPFEKGLTHKSSRLSVYWRAACGALGLLLATFFVHQTVELLHLAKRPGTFNLTVLAIQSRAV
jgi:hypothetical protein